MSLMPLFLRRHDEPSGGAAPSRAGSGADEDAALLRRYVETGSQDAFDQIVYRHAGWVYHACRRALRDAHLAEDATQAVFLLLARKVLSLSPQTHLGGWLYQACRYVLADVRKAETRYRRRQRAAAELALRRQAESLLDRPGGETSAGDPAGADERLPAAVDEALAALRDADRQAILMHFYEGLTQQQLAERLGISKEGAKKRISRALGRLRALLARGRRGHAPAARRAVSLATLAMLLRARGAEAAPARVVTDVARAAATPGLASATAELIVHGVQAMAARATERLLAKLALAACNAVLVVAVGGSALSEGLAGRRASGPTVASSTDQATPPVNAPAALPSAAISARPDQADSASPAPADDPRAVALAPAELLDTVPPAYRHGEEADALPPTLDPRPVLASAQVPSEADAPVVPAKEPEAAPSAPASGGESGGARGGGGGGGGGTWAATAIAPARAPVPPALAAAPVAAPKAHRHRRGTAEVPLDSAPSEVAPDLPLPDGWDATDPPAQRPASVRRRPSQTIPLAMPMKSGKRIDDLPGGPGFEQGHHPILLALEACDDLVAAAASDGEATAGIAVPAGHRAPSQAFSIVAGIPAHGPGRFAAALAFDGHVDLPLRADAADVHWPAPSLPRLRPSALVPFPGAAARVAPEPSGMMTALSLLAMGLVRRRRQDRVA